ncbi:MAG: hypothetical protein AAGI12_04400 [Pseudomonadota bacterium]
MITVFYHEHNPHPIQRMMGTVDGADKFIRPYLYQDLFRTMRFPHGTAIFTDTEYLSTLQMDVVAGVESALISQTPDARIMNRPSVALERFALLRALKRAGLSDVEATRLDGGDRPTRYPVFIRSEVGCYGPETGLLETPEALEEAVTALPTRNQPLKGRIAVSYEAQADKHGAYRKYGMLRIGDRLFPQHVMFSKNWMIKASTMGFDEASIAEELDYVVTNPHADLLREVFDVAGLQYGRADYGFRDGKLAVYEINSSPTLPNLTNVDTERLERRKTVRALVNEAFKALDDGKTKTSWQTVPHIEDSYRLVERNNWGALRRFIWRMHRRRSKQATKSRQ